MHLVKFVVARAVDAGVLVEHFSFEILFLDGLCLHPEYFHGSSHCTLEFFWAADSVGVNNDRQKNHLALLHAKIGQNAAYRSHSLQKDKASLSVQRRATQAQRDGYV